ETRTFQRVHGWGSPRSTELLAGPANHSSAPVVCANYKRQLLDGRNYNDALGLFQKLMGNVFWNVEHFLQHHATLFEAFLLLIQFLGIRCTIYEGKTYCGNHKSLHR